MDTRFWGPSGWKLLHSITGNYPEMPNDYDKNTYKIFFMTLPHILPCVYCRNSLDKYYKELPIEGGLDNMINKPLDSRENLERWLYDIHNLVNDKLRGQGLLKIPNPSFNDIKKKYNNNTCDEGWDFLYAIVLNYPEDSSLITICQLHNYILFFNYLSKVLPYSKFANKFNQFIDQNPVSFFISKRLPLSRWLYSLEKSSTDCTSCFSKKCKHVEKYRAGCKGKNDKKPTCRRIKNKKLNNN